MRVMRPEGPRDFMLISHDRGIVLCDKFSGAVLCISYPEELERLKALLNSIDVTRLKPEGGE
jgi:hypothetical protein